MKKTNRQQLDPDRDTMREEYDFGGAVRGVTAAKYAQGANIAVIDPDVLDVFPDSAAVNDLLRAIAPVLRRQKDTKTRRKAFSGIDSNERLPLAVKPGH